MNSFQSKTIDKARKIILDVADGRKKRHFFTDWEVRFINNLSDVPNDLELSELQNHYLNKIREKI